MRRRRARVVTVLSGTLATAALSGCLALPEDGPVVGAGAADASDSPGPMYIDPLPPRPGDSPTQVVKGFLDAMLATPVQTSVAREFLSARASESWDPQRTVTFAAASPPRGGTPASVGASAEAGAGSGGGGGGVVTVDLTDTHLIDERGAWQGGLGDQSLSFGMVVEDGEHRIAEPPDALVVPAQWYEPRFRQVSLSFFDPTGTILVPEPAFVPAGEQLASTLVRGLLAGPSRAGAGLTRSFLPSGLTAGLSVPVSEDGVADIALAGGSGTPSREQAELLLAQLTSTLRQDPAITAVRVSIDGEPLGVPGDMAQVGRDRGAGFAPYDEGASSPLYGLRAGRLISGSPGRLGPVAGPFGTSVLGVRSIAPDLPARSAAAVSGDGTSVLLGPVRRSGSVTEVLSGAVDLLRPTWDFSGRLWLVDRTEQGARVLSRRGETTRELDVPGVSGRDVRTFLVSRDGSRLVALVRDDEPGAGDSVWVSRIRHDAEGRVLEATAAVRIDDLGDAPTRIRDLAWRTPTGLAYLTRVDEGLFRVRGLNVDGAPGGLAGLSITVKGEMRGLVGSPAPSQSLFAVGPGALVPLVVRTDGPLQLDAQIADIFYSG